MLASFDHYLREEEDESCYRRKTNSTKQNGEAILGFYGGLTDDNENSEESHSELDRLRLFPGSITS